MAIRLQVNGIARDRRAGWQLEAISAAQETAAQRAETRRLAPYVPRALRAPDPDFIPEFLRAQRHEAAPSPPKVIVDESVPFGPFAAALRAAGFSLVNDGAGNVRVTI